MKAHCRIHGRVICPLCELTAQSTDRRVQTARKILEQTEKYAISEHALRTNIRAAITALNDAQEDK